mmetsp:Transcript_5531/g.7976  ORF Transcript_5531/g.7976 Transcript_5531/m.7976 type:complete len:495 (-) Transcript_5531:309-1793(-)|eukprot:CAMPEP_0195530964 /NCGR_PEP_ID=MMETSP0794_2-20130614/34085_1 /TAXON_ID=515487 /ORGANISM="Stephanopyxis turris, Strain CCMP 815" /LENGTH=494 /DNA_ID=CAMNT_0040662591 /DNA_START=102 /DNA_END=1586 /DNA_ORIENTATION=+
MAINHYAAVTLLSTAALALSSSSTASAFVPTVKLDGPITGANSVLSRRSMPCLNVATMADSVVTLENKEADGDDQRFGAMTDLSGIAFSGLKGKALSLNAQDFPKAGELRGVIPKDCFSPDTATSLGYLSVSIIGTAVCTAFGVNLLGLVGTGLVTLPLWIAYSIVTGTVAMGLWVLAHECGHGAFSKNKNLQDAVGYVLHSIMLVPYYSWQRSHAVHHKYTNHMDLGETHVPEAMDENGVSAEGSFELREKAIDTFGEDLGLKLWGGLQGFLHLGVGWPAYLLIGATGATKSRGIHNHFLPDPLTEPENPRSELFPGQWKEKVWQSDIGVATVLGIVTAWGFCNGFSEVMALYGGPLIVVNAWLVLYTWLQHTDVDVPHFGEEDHTFVRGALHTIDRPYDKLDPFGAIDFLHHQIGTTHVAHHFDSTIPHYKAQVATDAIKENYPEFYMYDPTPIPQALWRVCKGCTSVTKRGDRWVWDNKGLESQIETDARV